MRPFRLLIVAPLAFALAASASAQFDGPAPLAWRWIQPTSSAPSGAPVVSGETIFTAVGSRIFAIDRASGNLKWRYPQVEGINGLFRTSPVLVGDTLVAAADNKTVYAIDPTTGAPKWTYNSPSPLFGSPVSVGSYVAFATSDNKLIALEGTTGKPAWEPYNIYDRIQGQIAGYGGGIVFFTGLNELRSLDVVSKKANYLRPIKFGDLPPGATPVLYGDTFYVSSGPYVVAVNASTGQSKWQRNTGLQLAFSPAPGSNGVLVVSQNGEALVLDSLNGYPVDAMKRGPVKLGSYPAVRPSVVGTKFLVPTTNGSINLFDPTTGSLLWSYVVRPVGDLFETAATPQGAGRGGLGGPGGFGGPGGAGGQGASNTQKRIITLMASGPAVLDGTTLLVPAKDGSILAFDKELGVDLTPPASKQVWPTPGDVVNLRDMIFRTTDEAAGVNESTISVQIDGAPAYYTYSRDGYIQVAFSSIGKAPPAGATDLGTKLGADPKANPILQDGRHKVTVTLADWMGNVSNTDYSIVIDNALRPLPLPGTEQTGQAGPGGRGGGLGGPGGGGGEPR